MPEKKEKKSKSKSKKTPSQEQKYREYKSKPKPASRRRIQSSGVSRSTTSKPTGKKKPTNSNVNTQNVVLTFPSQEQMYRQVLTDVQNQPPPVLGNANDINASMASILNSIRQQNTPNKQEALASVVPKIEVLKEQATQAIKVEDKFNKQIERIKTERTQGADSDDISLLGDGTVHHSNAAANTIQGAVKGHLARNKARTRADEVVKQKLAPYTNAATKIQSAVRGHKGRKVHSDAVMEDFMNTDMAEAIKNAKKNGQGNFAFTLPKTPRKPVVMTTPPPPRKFPDNTLKSQLVFAPQELDLNTPPAKRGRGRPAGSVNKSKELKELEKAAKKLSRGIVSKSGKIKN